MDLKEGCRKVCVFGTWYIVRSASGIPWASFLVLRSIYRKKNPREPQNSHSLRVRQKSKGAVKGEMIEI